MMPCPVCKGKKRIVTKGETASIRPCTKCKGKGEVPKTFVAYLAERLCGKKCNNMKEAELDFWLQKADQALRLVTRINGPAGKKMIEIGAAAIKATSHMTMTDPQRAKHILTRMMEAKIGFIYDE